jgi:ATPase family associated with various cellular activities (AAA)/Winged helix domain, variant
MDELAQWQQGNEAFLAKALAWLRLRLIRLAPPEQVVMRATTELAASPRRRFWNRPLVVPASTIRALPPPAGSNVEGSSSVSDEQLTQALAEMNAAESATPPPAMRMLSQALGLSRFEQELLLLCAAMELDTRIGSLCARAQDDPQRTYPTFALAFALFDNPSWDALSPEGPLRRWRLIEINQPSAQPLTTSPLRADERIVNYLKGLNYLDDRLAPLFVPLDVAEPQVELPPSQQCVADQIVQRLHQAAPTGHLPVVQLLGRDPASKQLIAWRVATSLGLRLYRLPAEAMPAHAAELEALARLVDRETALWPLALYVDAYEVDKTTAEGPAPPLNRFLARSSGVCLLDTQEIRQGVGRTTLTFDIAKPAHAEQQVAWRAALGEADNGNAARLSGQFDLNLTTIQQSAWSVIADAASSGHMPLGDRLWDACLASTRPRMDALAQRIEPKATWDDIVLPPADMSLLRQLAAQVQHRHTVYEEWGFAAKRARGLSINALFAGESGTGKTLAAEVIANDLRLNLYRIDLSAVVSKYIGETEKNLRRLFDAAEDGGALLFFDEADALFGKRSEVKDSHDRYANIEINYLLQRMESYRGLAILATNMKSALDPAFMRRIRFVVEFRPHGLEERKAIWQRIFPPETRTQGLDFERLARLTLNGGSINNVAINAAFLAAQAGTPVTIPLVLEAARAEYQKLKRPINNDDFV